MHFCQKSFRTAVTKSVLFVSVFVFYIFCIRLFTVFVHVIFGLFGFYSFSIVYRNIVLYVFLLSFLFLVFFFILFQSFLFVWNSGEHANILYIIWLWRESTYILRWHVWNRKKNYLANCNKTSWRNRWWSGLNQLIYSVLLSSVSCPLNDKRKCSILSQRSKVVTFYQCDTSIARSNAAICELSSSQKLHGFGSSASIYSIVTPSRSG